MHDYHKRLFPAILCLGLLVLAACVSRPTLQPKFAGVPPGVDLSGHWQIRSEPGGLRQPQRGAGSEPIVPRPLSSRRRSQGRNSRMTGNPVEVFLEHGEVLKISQTYYGLFISYDRSVVEEYTFGENRKVTIGPIEAQRVSGWADRSFVVETLDTGGARLFETWQIRAGGDELTRDVRISKNDKDLFAAQQTYDRIRK